MLRPSPDLLPPAPPSLAARGPGAPSRTPLGTPLRAVLAALALVGAPACAPPPALAQDLAQDGASLRVSSRAELDAALDAAAGGETILLGDGSYGELIMGHDFDPPVTLRAERQGGARFSRLGFDGATGIAVERVAVVEGLPVQNGSTGIAIRQVDLGGTLYVRNASDVVIEDSHVHDGQYGVSLNTVRGFVVRQNDISGATEDLVRITGDSSGLLELNFIHDPANASGHPDCIQLFGSNSPGTKYTPHDVTIRRNHLYALGDGESDTRYDGAQGIFVSDPRTTAAYRNLLIAENLIQVQFPNALYIDGGQENVVVRNNTLIPNGGDGSAIIRLAEKSGFDNAGTTVTGNVVKLINDETRGSPLGDNYVYGRDAPLARLFAGTDGRDWRSFAPVPRTRIDFGSGYGAEAFLADLLAGRARIGPSWSREG